MTPRSPRWPRRTRCCATTCPGTAAPPTSPAKHRRLGLRNSSICSTPKASRRLALVAHSMGTLVANTFAARYPDRVTKVALLGAVRAQNEQAKTATRGRARTVRDGGMSAVADTIVGAAPCPGTHADRPVAVAAVRESLLGQDPQGYAGACEALAAAAKPASPPSTHQCC